MESLEHVPMSGSGESLHLPHHACNLSTAAPPMAVVETEFGLAREFYWC